MKRLLLVVILFLSAIVPMAAQKKDGAKRPSPEMRKEMREFKIKFIAQEIDLKEDQKKPFAELYNEMSEERWQIFHEIKNIERKLKNDKNASEADYEAAAKAITEAKERDAAIEKKYDAKFSTFLTSRQIFKMKGAEETYRQKMHEMHRKKKADRDAKKIRK